MRIYYSGNQTGHVKPEKLVGEKIALMLSFTNNQVQSQGIPTARFRGILRGRKVLKTR